MKWIRWTALLPLAVTLVLIALAVYFYLDPAVRRGVEVTGTEAVGARVDLASAHVALGDGSVTLRGLAVTDPARPMTNLFEVEEIVFRAAVVPALERKVVIDTMAVRGVRFGTVRKTSGALPARAGVAGEGPGALRRAVDDWRSRVKVPPISLNTLTQSVNVDAISAESLATLRAARGAHAYADTARAKLIADLQALDPRGTIDSATALATRLEKASLRSLGLGGVRTAVADVRRTVTALNELDDRLRDFQAATRANAAGLTERLEAIPAARQADYAYARSLLRLPTFDIPSIGPQLFSPIFTEKVGELMYWARLLEQYVPPGLERQFRAGPSRVRASGTDVLFPKARVYPDFLTRLAELTLAIGGEGAAAGAYSARVEGLTTQPAVYGAPTRFELTRSGGRAGPTDVRVSGSMDHRRAPVQDALQASFSGITLPTVVLNGVGARLDFGTGVSELRVARRGDSLDGRWLWRATRVRWTRDTLTQARATSPAMRLVEDALWRAVSRIDSVEVEARFDGPISGPRLGIRTNIASAVGNALRDQMGDEVRRAEQQVRARVDALVDARVAEARTKADAVKADVEARIAAERARLEEQKVALEARLKELVRIPGVGSPVTSSPAPSSRR